MSGNRISLSGGTTNAATSSRLTKKRPANFHPSSANAMAELLAVLHSAVKPSRQQRGIGSALVSDAQEHARGRDTVEIAAATR
jgi:hypothetical protein